jgi:predicted phosphodiesterase
MKIGIISDVHADLPSLIAALELLTKRGADRILCSGDLVERGPDGDAVVETVKSREILTVRGNHDLAVISNQRWLREMYGADPRIASRILKEESLSYLSVLPPTLTLTLGDEGEERTHIVVAHGIPSSESVYLYPYSNRRAFDNAIEEAHDLDPLVQVLILGHTHQPMIARVGEFYVLNAGSVCGIHTQGDKFVRAAHTAGTALRGVRYHHGDADRAADHRTSLKHRNYHKVLR